MDSTEKHPVEEFQHHSEGQCINIKTWQEYLPYVQFNPVGKLKPNRFGLYDMPGNVAEWCAKPTADATNVVRGGAFSEPATSLRCAARLIETPDWDALDPEFPRSPWWLTADFVGFRVALDAGID